MPLNGTVLTVGIVLGLFLFVILFFAFNFKKAPSNKAIVVSGVFPKIFTGKGSLVLPVLQRADTLNIGTFSIDVKSQNAIPTKEFLSVLVDAQAICKIGTSDEMLALAAQNFLNRDTDFMAKKLTEVLEGNIREIVGQLELQAMIQDKKSFSEKVLENVVPDLAKMGIELISLTVQDFKDKTGIIASLGTEHAARIQTKANEARAEAEAQQAEMLSIAAQRKAKADAEAQIEEAKQESYARIERAKAEAEANQMKNEADIKAETAIAIKKNELLVKEAALKEETDIAKAKANTAYKIEEQQQRKELEARQADAEIVRQEKAIIVRKREAEVKAQTLDAEINKQADAERYRREQLAAAEKREKELEAEAKLIEAELHAKSIEVEAKAKAEAVRVEGLAEAEAVKAKGLAEAIAIKEKAEAMKEYGHAAMAEMMIKVLPEIAKAVAEPISAIDEVRIIGGDSNGVSGISNNVPVLMANTFESVKAATGVDLTELMRAPIEQTRNINLDLSEEVRETMTEEINNAIATATGTM